MFVWIERSWSGGPSVKYQNGRATFWRICQNLSDNNKNPVDDKSISSLTFSLSKLSAITKSEKKEENTLYTHHEKRRLKIGDKNDEI